MNSRLSLSESVEGFPTDLMSLLRHWKNPKRLFVGWSIYRHQKKLGLKAENPVEKTDIMSDLLSEYVNNASNYAGKLDFQMLPFVHAGSIRSGEVNAEARRYFGAAAVIGVHDGLYTFCWLLAKGIAPLLGRRNGLVFELFAETKKREIRRSLWRLSALLIAYAKFKRPGAAPLHNPNELGPALPVAQALLFGMEQWALAHEFAHLLFAHSDIRFGSTKNEELAADVFAIQVLLDVTHCEIEADVMSLIKIAGPFLFIRQMEILEKANLTLPPKEHPPWTVRWTAMLDVVNKAIRTAEDDCKEYSVSQAIEIMAERLNHAWNAYGERVRAEVLKD
jgi:hypothetical protein